VHGNSHSAVSIMRETWRWLTPAMPLVSLLLFSQPCLAQTNMALSAATVMPSTTPFDLHLEVFVNGVSTRLIAHLRLTPDGRLLIEPDQLHNIGLLPVAAAQRDDGWIDLGLLPGVASRYDDVTQTLHIQARDAAMVVRVFDAQALEKSLFGAEGPAPQATRDFGGFINHTLYYNTGGDGWAGLRRSQSASALFEGNLYGRLGNLNSTHILNTTRGADRRFRAVRLDTRWSWFDEDRLMTVSAGDFVTSSLPWSRAVRLAGIQLRRNFAIRPDLVTMPMLSDLSGSAAVPSTVELYVNNARRLSQDVRPGPFAVTNLPLVTGSGTARLVVRDVLGRETVTELPFYASSRLLAQGLSDFSLQTGVARYRYGTMSHDYDNRVFTAATVRYGWSNAVTLESMAQAGGRLTLAGAGAVVKLGTLGVAALAGSFSRYGGDAQAGRETGAHLTASLETEALGMKLFARHQRTSGDFNDMASVALAHSTTSAVRRNAAPPRSMSQISLTFSRLTQPSLNLSYTPMRLHSGSRSRLLGMNASMRVGRNTYLSVSTYRDLSRSHSLSGFATVSWFLDDRINAASSLAYNQGSQATTTLELSRSEQQIYDSVAWRLRAAHGNNRSAAANASYRSRAGRFEADVERTTHNTYGRATWDGALVFAGGGVFLANRIDDAFAVVNVGAPDVEVQYENNPIGKTNARGQLLLSGLRAYERNRISIDPMRLPVDTHVPVLHQIVRPRTRSGVMVDFGVALQTRVALITIRDEAGALLPVGTTLRLNDGASFMVGYDGQVWLEDIAGDNRLRVEQTGRPACVVQFSAPETMTQRLVIPDAVCRSVP